MNLAGLSLDQSPPLSVPARFFLTAPWFGAVAALALLIAGPEALAHRWTPQALALTHLLTLGFLAPVMMGAMMQMLPVVAGTSLPRPRLVAALLHPLLLLGTAALSWGLWHGQRVALTLGTALLGAALVLFIATAGVALWRARSARFTVVAMRLALAALAVTALLGLLLAEGHARGAPPRQLTDLHLTWGLAGWVGLLVAGVAYQVVPLFQITPDYPKALQRWLPWALAAGLLTWSLPAPPAQWAGEALLALAALTFTLVTLRLQMRRKRRINDASLWLWRLALASLLLATLLRLPPLAAWSARPLATGMLLLPGFAVSLMSAMLYKIAPFLVWLHLNNRLFRHGAAGVKVPNMKQVIAEKAARRQLYLHAPAVALLAAAPLWPPLLYPGALLFGLSCTLLGWNLLTAMGVYRRVAAEMVAKGG